jgi:hypothetical protein
MVFRVNKQKQKQATIVTEERDPTRPDPPLSVWHRVSYLFIQENEGEENEGEEEGERRRVKKKKKKKTEPTRGFEPLTL